MCGCGCGWVWVCVCVCVCVCIRMDASYMVYAVVVTALGDVSNALLEGVLGDAWEGAMPLDVGTGIYREREGEIDIEMYKDR